MADWEKGDNKPKINRIKKALFDILGDEQQTEKAFACIAKQKYGVTLESEQPEKQPDSLTFRFGKNDNDEWISESKIVHDFALAHPDCSFALGNAVLEYLDEKQHSDTPFWETPDIQGEQLTLFGDSEPLTALKPAKEKPKSEFAKGPVVNGVQVYEALQRKLIVEQAL